MVAAWEAPGFFQPSAEWLQGQQALRPKAAGGLKCLEVTCLHYLIKQANLQERGECMEGTDSIPPDLAKKWCALPFWHTRLLYYSGIAASIVVGLK